ncbi:bile acid:sodium symporter family protein [Scopulibacillus cellulosilyticus]|uniref:Bile acid:sodium symporter family protein n=1 Tax=Scopulibacillus cellulosilyticus TaxID=2665665 RepID=A0ABW2PS45_9BACL
MLQQLNRQLEKCMPLITPISVVLGILLTHEFKSFLFLVPWIFAFMTFTGSLSSNFKHLKEVITHPFPVLVALVILHILMPLWALGIGHIVFSKDSLTVTGLVLGMVIPSGITSFIWVSIYRGQIPVALSIILIDTLLSPLIVPYSLSFFVHEKAAIDVWPMMKDLLIMIVIPSVLGMLLNQLTNGKVKDTIGTRLAPFSKVCMGIVVMINASVAAPYLSHINKKLILIAFIVFIIAASGYLFCWIIGKLLRWDRGMIVTLIYSGGMRNISAGSVIALTYFHPPVAVPVIIGMLFQQVLASFYGYMLHIVYDKKEEQYEKRLRKSS